MGRNSTNHLIRYIYCFAHKIMLSHDSNGLSEEGKKQTETCLNVVFNAFRLWFGFSPLKRVCATFWSRVATVILINESNSSAMWCKLRQNVIVTVSRTPSVYISCAKLYRIYERPLGVHTGELGNHWILKQQWLFIARSKAHHIAPLLVWMLSSKPRLYLSAQ